MLLSVMPDKDVMKLITGEKTSSYFRLVKNNKAKISGTVKYKMPKGPKFKK